jgi:hypothetical protein
VREPRAIIKRLLACGVLGLLIQVPADPPGSKNVTQQNMALTQQYTAALEVVDQAVRTIVAETPGWLDNYRQV